MPRVIDAESEDSCSLEAAIEGIAAIEFDPGCEESLHWSALWLRKLNNNRDFLGDMLIEQLKQRHRDIGLESGYGPQAIALSPRIGSMFLRANIWPAEQDLCFRTSGAQNFVYGLPHDHNFSFLTSGYLGPGYRSDYYEYDYQSVAGYPGEKAALRFVERSALREGKLMLYRAHQDIHSQLPPDSLSVSINVMHIDPAQHWYDQYGFDLDTSQVTRVLSPNTTEAFLRVSVATGTDEAREFAEWVGRSHPSDRMRLASYEARSLQAGTVAERDLLWREAGMSGSRMLSAVASERRAALESA